MKTDRYKLADETLQNLKLEIISARNYINQSLLELGYSVNYTRINLLFVIKQQNLSQK